MLVFKDFKYRYRKTHQRARFKNFKFFKNSKKSFGFGHIQLLSLGKNKCSGRQLSSAFIIVKRRLKKRKGELWTPLFHDRLDFWKTKGVRMGGGRGKHYSATLKFNIGSIIFEGWLRRGLFKGCKRLLKKAAKRLSVPSKVVLTSV
jgi:ribosomal protein L16/L10AE